MDDQTTQITKPGESETDEPSKPNESHLFNISVRGWIALIFAGGFVAMNLLKIPIDAQFAAIAGMAVGSYIGQGSKPKSQTQ